MATGLINIGVMAFRSIVNQLTHVVDDGFKSSDQLLKEKKEKYKVMEAGFGVNPFLSNFELFVAKVDNTGLYKKDKEGDLLPKSYIVERDKKVNVYVNSVYRKVIANLSNNGKCLFLHILYELDSGKDYIEINKDRYMRENDVKSLNTFKSSVAELKKLGIISEIVDMKWLYFINPRFFFCGNRVEVFSKYVKEYVSDATIEAKNRLEGEDDYE